jgi:glycosyltransferase involved in cell wall biosynthesis
MHVSVIVITRNHSSYLVEALTALSKQDYPDFEIVVVDSSEGEEREKSAQLAEQFKAIYVYEPRRGQSLARNSGLPFCTGEIIAFTDDDCLPEKDWLSLLIKNYSSPQIWGCSGRIIPHRRESAADLFEEVAGQDLGEIRREFKPADVRFSVGLVMQNVGKVFAKHLKGKGLAPWNVGHGSSMSFRKTALDQLGGFDDRCGAGAPLKSGEDIDINYRVLRSGHDIIYEPTAIVRHNHHRMTKDEVFYTRHVYSHGGAALMYENRGNLLMFCMLCGRFVQLIIKIIQYKLTGQKELARVFSEDLSGVRAGIAAQKKNPRDPKIKPDL